MMMAQLSLKTIRKTKASEIIKTLYSGQISAAHVKPILKICVLFLNSEDAFVRELGYRILLKYSISSANYIPLYEVAAGLGFTPITALLQNHSHIPKRDGFLSTFMEAYCDSFKEGEAYQTERQRLLFLEFESAIKQSIAVIAPTSYGKSQLIELTVASQNKKNIAIIVPSKALISQTRRRVIQALPENRHRQVIVHHDVTFDSQTAIIAVVTQERLLRILQKHQDISFDIVFVDEAHNLLSGDKRARLLASSLIINKIRSPKAAVKYLTPFLVDASSLQLINEEAPIREVKITEKLKAEEYYMYDFFAETPVLRYYDQYFDCFFDIASKSFGSELEFLAAKKRSKNIVYLNKPKNIELFAEQLAKNADRSSNEKLDEICNEIADYVHPQYRILRCLRAGVAYHHGAVPDVVRGYIENAFKDISSISWIVTNSTLLEGINIPAEALFVLDPSKGRGNLSPAQFRNLVGRINRFSEIFDPESGTPARLLPATYLLKCSYSRRNANFSNYLKNVAKVDAKISDLLANPLLVNTDLTEEDQRVLSNELSFIENIEPRAELRNEPQRAVTTVGRLCSIHNIFEIDISRCEQEIQVQVDTLISGSAKISDAQKLMDLIHDIFVSKIDVDSADANTSLIRLTNKAARSFYAMFFDWRINQVNYGRMISNFIAYWKKILAEGTNTAVYVGRWGTIARDGFLEHYVDLKHVSDYELINLAIVRIKEEQDFVDNSLVKFLEVFNDLGIVDEKLYNTVKYGTANVSQIALIRSGLSHIAASVLTSDYKRYLKIDIKGNVRIDNRVRDAFANKQERKLIVFEVETSGLMQEIPDK